MAFTWEAAAQQLEERRQRAMGMGGPAKIERQHKQGKLTARERIDRFVDGGTFKEIGTLALYERPKGDGSGMEVTPSSFISGLAKVGGRSVAMGVNDYTVSGGTTTIYLARLKGELGGFTDDLAYEYKIPLISLLEGAGAGDDPRSNASPQPPDAGFGRALKLLDEVPCLTAILGPTAGFAAARAVLSHFSVMTKDTACMFMGGPPVVKGGLGIDIDKFALGGHHIHTTVGGIDNLAEDEDDAFRQVKTVLSFLPQNVWQAPPVIATDDPITRRNDAITSIVPENRKRAYDSRKIIREVFDRDSFFEIGPHWGRSIIQGLARIGGYPVGVVAGNSYYLGGALDAQSCEKQARFLEFCDTFHLPVVFMIDNGGFMIGEEAERSGIARSAARAMMEVLYIESPIVTVYMRKAYGLGPLSQTNPVKLGLRLAWPSTETGGMPAEGEVETMFRRELAEAEDREAYKQKAIEIMVELRQVWRQAENFAMEEVIHPAETREYIGRFIEASWDGVTSKLGPPKRRPRI